MSSEDDDSTQGLDSYDPNQDPDEKLRIRTGYRDQLQQLGGQALRKSPYSPPDADDAISEQARDFKSVDVNVLIEGVQRANKAFDDGKFQARPH